MHIVTERLVLRDYEANDWPAVLAYQNDKRYFRFYPWAERTEAEVRAFVQIFLDWQAEQPRRKFQFAITLPSDGRLIGSCGIRRKNENDWEADIGYELAPQYWGQGFATEAAAAIVRFGFRELDLHRISSWCIAENITSARVLERLGMRLEGQLRENDYFKGRWWDVLLYGLLENEWKAQP
jgi:RimJ/RimL family protein N-acetyltransferase